MNIFESLENLNVSEECFDDIMGIVEELLSEDIHSAIDTYAKTDKKGRDALHKKARENKERQEDTDYDRKYDPTKEVARTDKDQKYDDTHSHHNRVRQRELKRWAKSKGLNSPKRYEFATGEYYTSLTKDAAPRGKEVRNEVGEKATKARSAKAVEKVEDKEKAIRDIGDMYIRKDIGGSKKYNRDKKAVDNYLNSRKDPKKSAEDKSVDRHYEKHPVEYDNESPWA